MDVFAALANPTRRRMLDLLTHGERSSGDFAAAFAGLTQPAISRHLRVLRTVGLVKVRAEAQRRMYTLRTEPLSEVDAWLLRYRRFRSNHGNPAESSFAATGEI
ncbi:metalloregulator ArsR/SmtB family transcription factor [Dactylosporangium sp. NPDC049525]|uniref:ArsR/SmtB family transcription factor n=1 Tax=Dactylosporangium sp. NPDC049525 TaxID=3154730 RepID=UPI003418C393